MGASGFGESKHSRYSLYLQSNTWKQFKARYFASHRPKKCLICFSDRVQLHHVTYARIGREKLIDVVPLCRKHHIRIHELLDANGWSVDKSSVVIDVMRDEVGYKRKERPKDGGGTVVDFASMPSKQYVPPPTPTLSRRAQRRMAKRVGRQA